MINVKHFFPKKLDVPELLNVRQCLLIIPHFLADVKGAVQKSQMFLHMHMEKAVCLPRLELEMHTINESLRSLRGMCSKDTNTFRKIEVESRDLRSRASALER